MLAMKVTIDEKSLKAAAHILRAIPRSVPRAFRRAINRSVDSAATDIKRKVSDEITMKKGVIAKSLIKKKASFSNMTGTIAAKDYRPGLLEFPGTKQNKRGITYRISKTAGRKKILHGFIAVMPSGHRGVFLRKDVTRLPLQAPRGPSIWHIITDTAGLLAAATDKAGDQMSKLINDQLEVEFKRWNR